MNIEVIQEKSPSKKGFFAGAPEGSRTPNPQLRRLMLYPVELPAQKICTKILRMGVSIKRYREEQS